jgi:hypothetical protein
MPPDDSPGPRIMIITLARSRPDLAGKRAETAIFATHGDPSGAHTSRRFDLLNDDPCRPEQPRSSLPDHVPHDLRNGLGRRAVPVLPLPEREEAA